MSLVSAKDLTVRYGPRLVLDRVGFGLREGEIIGLIGPNGAGKTTLLKVLAGLVRPDSGELSVVGKTPISRNRREIARQIAYLAQGAVVHWPLSVERVVALGRLPHLGPWQRPTGTDREAIARALVQAEVIDLTERSVTTLSDGERTRVLLARALAVEPRLLLADEPVTTLDPSHQLKVMELLRALARRGGGVVVVLHDLTLAARFCDRISLLHQGRMLAVGDPPSVLTPENLQTAYGLRALHGSSDGELYVIPWETIGPTGPESRAGGRA